MRYELMQIAKILCQVDALRISDNDVIVNGLNFKQWAITLKMAARNFYQDALNSD